MNLSSTLQRIGFWIVIATISLVPIFFLPITSEFYEFNKQALLVVSSLILLLLWTGIFVIERQVRVTRSPFGLALFLFALTWIISTFTKTPNRIDAIMQPTATTSIVALTIFFFTSINFIRSRRELETAVFSLIGSLVILGLVTILWTSGLPLRIFPDSFLKNTLFTPTGNPLATLVSLASLAPLLIVLIFKEKANSAKTFLYALSLFITVIAVSLISYRIFRPTTPATGPAFLSHSTAWAIALEALKISPFLGTGPATFITDFTRFRPVSYNLTSNWAIRFTASSNYYLYILTTLGLLGLVSYGFVVLRSVSVLIKVFRSTSDSPLHSQALAILVSLFALFISQLLLPASFSSLFFTYALLVLLVSSLKHLGSSLVHEANIDVVAVTDTGSRSPLLPTFTFVLAVVFAGLSSYVVGFIYYGEFLFQKAIAAAAKNQAKTTYDTLASVIRINPYIDTYRIAYSQTNLLIANSLATKKDLNEDDRNTITQLIQQSVREAKQAVALNPAKASNVENLAGVYQNLLNLAQGADAWTLASYKQAILLDPINPGTRIALGSLFYANKNYDEAIRLFQQAVDLKPNLANAHYNLAAAFREKGDYAQALNSMQTVINLVDKSSADYSKALSEAEDLRKKVGQLTTPSNAVSAPAKSELTAPKPLPTPKINPPLQLPSELSPETTPQPTPLAPSPTP